MRLSILTTIFLSSLTLAYPSAELLDIAEPLSSRDSSTSAVEERAAKVVCKVTGTDSVRCREHPLLNAKVVTNFAGGTGHDFSCVAYDGDSVYGE
jgi:hypothetical protein